MDAKALLDSLDVGVAAIAPDWTIVEWTASAARITGVPADRALGQGFWVAFPSAKGTHVERTLQEVWLDGRPRSYLTPAGPGEFHGQVFETRVTRGARNHMILLFREMHAELSPESQAAHILTAFEQERRFYRQLFDALPTPALVLSVDGQILEANPQAVDLLSAGSGDALRGRPLADWTTAAARPTLSGALRVALRERQRLRVPIEISGEPLREVDAVIENVDPGDGRAIPRLLFLAVDVSREVLLQRKLFQTDRLSQLGALVSGVAHELNNPLAAISAFAELLAVDARDAQLRESAEVIHSEAMRAGRVVQTLLDFARQRPRVRQPVDLQDIVDRVLSLQRNVLKRARARTVVAISDDVPPVNADPQELQQIVLNGIVNALQAIEGTGRPGTIEIRGQQADGHVSLIIEDTGPGLSPEALDRVFEPFFTTKGEAGTGLGLTITLGLVKGLGGRMWLQNVEGGGARLTVELPAETALPEEEAKGGFHPAERSLSVLIVEDEVSVRRGVKLMAERLGHRVHTVTGFQEALDSLHAEEPRYDALLIDVHLDDAHTGFDLFEELLQEGRGRERHVVFTTGDSISARTRDRLQRAERPVLRKPFNLEELREMLDRVAN
jgi:signal transduction histidine kinase/ActR/RegA family two-component response regulator